MILCFGILFGSCLVASAIDFPERYVPKMTYYVSRGTLNSTHSRINAIIIIIIIIIIILVGYMNGGGLLGYLLTVQQVDVNSVQH